VMHANRHFLYPRDVFDPDQAESRHDRLVCRCHGRGSASVDPAIAVRREPVVRDHDFGILRHRQDRFGLGSACQPGSSVAGYDHKYSGPQKDPVRRAGGA
jgi:hypothetical protein